jgi:hypothetical protein
MSQQAANHHLRPVGLLVPRHRHAVVRGRLALTASVKHGWAQGELLLNSAIVKAAAHQGV